MKKLISLILVAVLSLSVLTACGKKDTTSDAKTINYDDYVDRFIDSAKQMAKNAKTPEEKEISKPKVEKTKKERYHITKLVYEDDKTLEIFSNPDTDKVNGANLRVYVSQKTKEADLKKFFILCEDFIRQSDPAATDEEIAALIEKFKKAIPDDPTAPNYTGMCTYAAEINNLCYLAYYDFTTEPASCELLFS